MTGSIPAQASLPLEVSRICAQSLTLNWQDGFASEFHFIWLRDNCRCNECGDPVIGRRSLRLTGIDTSQTPEFAEIRGGDLFIRWPDGHQSLFSGDWIRAHSYDDASRLARSPVPELWTTTFISEPPVYGFADLLDSDQALFQLLKTLLNKGLAFISGAPSKPGMVEKLAARIGPVQESNFGRIQDIVIDNRRKSIANSVDALKPHTDEPYRASPPGILMFHCIETDTEGAGASLFLDGFEAATALRLENPECFSVLCRCRQGYRRHFEGEVNLYAEFPPISVDEFGTITGVRINDRVAAPLSTSPELMTTYYSGMKRLLEFCEDPDRMLYRTLQPGDIAIFDNHRILHGRTQLSVTGRRWLQWAQVNRGDFQSRARILAERSGVGDFSARGHGAY